MENFDNLVISLIDADANKGLFISELCRILNLPKICVGEIYLNTKLNNGVITQEVCVEMINAEIKKGLEDAGFKCYGGINSPYIWLEVPNELTSWEFFCWAISNRVFCAISRLVAVSGFLNVSSIMT